MFLAKWCFLTMRRNSDFGTNPTLLLLFFFFFGLGGGADGGKNSSIVDVGDGPLRRTVGGLAIAAEVGCVSCVTTAATAAAIRRRGDEDDAAAVLFVLFRTRRVGERATDDGRGRTVPAAAAALLDASTLTGDRDMTLPLCCSYSLEKSCTASGIDGVASAEACKASAITWGSGRGVSTGGGMVYLLLQMKRDDDIGW